MMLMNRKIILTGATGLIGQNLCAKLISQGDEITIFTRNPGGAKKIILDETEIVEWNHNNPDEWKDYLEGKDAIIHLAGASLAAKRWNENYKLEIYNAIRNCGVKPKVFITASAVGYYGNRGDDLLIEESQPGEDFLAKLCYDWENEAEKVEQFDVRNVSLRIGLVLSKKGGVLKQFLIPFKLFIGGPLGNGNQWFPWIHIDDLLNILVYTLNNESLKRSVNSVSPGIVKMKDFASTLGNVLHRPSLFPVPKLLLRIIAGEIADSIVSGQRISVDKLLKSGFDFKFDNLTDALKDLLKTNR
jgi:uncharacterized protein (TIGR01777 family)